MKGITFIFLATLLYAGDPQKTENLYSWQITFQSYDQCKLFYNAYQADILNGLLDHGTKKFGKIDGAVHSAYPKSSKWGTKFEDLDPEYLNQDLIVSQKI